MKNDIPDSPIDPDEDPDNPYPDDPTWRNR